MTTYNFIAVGADTDGLAFKKPDESEFTQAERQALLADLNSRMDTLIKFEDDGVFIKQIVVKTKNYVLVDEAGNTKIKGSALKASMKEKGLKRFVSEVIDCLIEDKIHLILPVYFSYAKEILSLKDMTEWCSKKTITKAVLTNDRTNEKRIRDALKGKPVQEGDKIFVFFKTDTEITLLENFDGTYHVPTLLEKLYKTMKIFETVYDIKNIPNLTLKKNKELLEGLNYEKTNT